MRIDKIMMAKGFDVDIVKRQEEAAEVMFADMISMNCSTEVDNSGVETADEALSTVKTEKFDTRKEKPEETYEKYKYKDKTIRTKSEGTDTVKVEEAKAEIEEFEEAITEVISEELHVSKEELEVVMEELGLTYLDLLDNSNLGMVAIKITGCENIGQLLCNEGFLNVLNEVKILGGELLNNLQMTPEEFVEFKEVFEQVVEEISDNTKQVVEEISDNTKNKQSVEKETGVSTYTGEQNIVESESNTAVAENTEQVTDLEKTDENIIVKNQQETEQIVKTEVVEQAVEEVSEEWNVLNTTESTEEVVIDEAVEEDTQIPIVDKMEDMDTSEESASEEGEQKFGKSDSKTLNTVHMPQTNEHVVVKDVQTVTFASQLGEFETVQTLPPQVTVADIMEQFAEHTRIMLSADTTRMEMQLNPEHLGKLYLEVVESEGVITAKLQTQSIEVKEALETQIADLKVNLNQAGVKVDSVEVTIASHEFERNLEQDANSQKQQEEARSQMAGHRNINLNELDELSGLMSEEEALVAKMMAEQGNSVDFSA